MYNHSRVCYFGLAKPVWSSGILQGDRRKVKGPMRNGTGCPSLYPLPAHPDRPEAQLLWQVGILVLPCSGNKNKCLSFLWGSKRTTPISSKGLFWRREGHRVCAKVSSSVWPHTGPFFWIWSACQGKEKLHQHHKHSERVALVQGGPSQAWLHGLRAWWQFEESGCRHELAYVSLLCDASVLKASVGQRRHLAQCAEACLCEGAGVHGQTNGNQPIRHR